MCVLEWVDGSVVWRERCSVEREVQCGEGDAVWRGRCSVEGKVQRREGGAMWRERCSVPQSLHQLHICYSSLFIEHIRRLVMMGTVLKY